MVCTVFIHISISHRSIDVRTDRSAGYICIGSQCKVGIAKKVAHVPFRGFHAQGITRGAETFYYTNIETICCRKHNSLAFFYAWHTARRISHGQRAVSTVIASRYARHTELQVYIVGFSIAIIADVYFDGKLISLSGFEHLVFRQGVMIILILECNLDKLCSLSQCLWHNDGRSGISAFGGNTGLDISNVFCYTIQFARLRIETRSNIYSAKGYGSIVQVLIPFVNKRHIDFRKLMSKAQGYRIRCRRDCCDCPKQVAVKVTFIRALVSIHGKGMIGTSAVGIIRMVGCDSSIGCAPIDSGTSITQRAILPHYPSYIFVVRNSTRNGDTYLLTFGYLCRL